MRITIAVLLTLVIVVCVFAGCKAKSAESLKPHVVTLQEALYAPNATGEGWIACSEPNFTKLEAVWVTRDMMFIDTQAQSIRLSAYWSAREVKPSIERVIPPGDDPWEGYTQVKFTAP